MKKKVRCGNCGCYNTINNVVYGKNIIDFRCGCCKMFNYFTLVIRKPLWKKRQEKRYKDKNDLLLKQHEIFNRLKEEFDCNRAELLLGNK